MPNRQVDLSEKKFGRIYVVKRLCREFVESRKSQPWQTKWLCKCECGTFFTCYTHFISLSYKLCCWTCSKSEMPKRKLNPNKKTGTKIYKAWQHSKSRCTCPTDPKYPIYKDRGFCADWLNDFEAFAKELGPIPDSMKGRRVSVGRIDNNTGYFPGNIRWEIDPQQARNVSMQSDNTSGVTGVYRYFVKGFYGWVACWMELDGTKVTRTFSSAKYGEQQAFDLAVAKRKEMIAELNAQGAGYSETHGLPRS